MVRQDPHRNVREVSILERLVAEPAGGSLLEVLAGARSKGLVQPSLPPQVMEEECGVPDSLPHARLDEAIVERGVLQLILSPRLLLCRPPHVLQHTLHIHLCILGDGRKLSLLRFLVCLLQPSRPLHLCDLQLPLPRPGLGGHNELSCDCVLLLDRFGESVDLHLLPPGLRPLLVPPRLYLLPLVVGEQQLWGQRSALLVRHHSSRCSLEHRPSQQDLLERLEVKLDCSGKLLQRHLLQLHPPAALGEQLHPPPENLSRAQRVTLALGIMHEGQDTLDAHGRDLTAATAVRFEGHP
mmetsp:Transcript_41587/g.131068  ORF Transcript_41587/g.131068 Transcript_41587/m.131068 type:complete len:296 (-) Transcript_41587:518-1405(-)